MSFDARFARDIMLPLVEATYQVFEKSDVIADLPPGYRQTALVEADLGAVSAMADLPESARTFVATVTAASTVFGLLGNNPDPGVQTAFVAFRGTRTDAEWLRNINIATTAYRPVPNFGDVHMGWMALYETLRASLVANLATACAGCSQLVVGGHSLGAALAVLAAPDIVTNMPPNLEPKLTTFGGPRAGLQDFVVAFNTTIDSCYRVVNQFDIVPHLPLPFPRLPYGHVGVPIAVDSHGSIDRSYRHSLPAYRIGLDRLIAAETPAAVTLGVGGDIAAMPVLASAAVTHAPDAATLTAAGETDQAVLGEGLAILAAQRDRTYYDASADAEAIAAYYLGIEESSGGTALLTRLHVLLTDTHTSQPRYAPTRMVYPWVDLHPDRKLRSVYSGKTFDPEDVIREDARIETLRTRRLQEVVAREAALGPETFADELARLDAQLPYNCEHVVPQSSFRDAEPMRGDLHHLFTCEMRCNSFRGNTPYFDFQDDRAVMADCGRSEPGRFEPSVGKGAVARATLYFLLRYPAVIGDVAGELQADRVPILLDWHEAEPVGEWERHRNAAIAELQGNRNPLIDHPEWAARIPFQAAFGTPGGQA